MSLFPGLRFAYPGLLLFYPVGVIVYAYFIACIQRTIGFFHLPTVDYRLLTGDLFLPPYLPYPSTPTSVGPTQAVRRATPSFQQSASSIQYPVSRIQYHSSLSLLPIRLLHIGLYPFRRSFLRFLFLFNSFNLFFFHRDFLC